MSSDCWNEIGVWAAGGATCPLLAEVVHCHNCNVFARAGRGLLDQPAPPGYLETWREELARTKGGDDNVCVSLFVFRIASQWLALPMNAVAEVAETLPVRRVPGRMAGLVNVHGEIGLCFSLPSLLGIAAADAPARAIVIEDGDGRWVFHADEVWGIVQIAADAMFAAPDGTAHVRSIVDWERGAISCLDDRALFATLQRRAVEA